MTTRSYIQGLKCFLKSEYMNFALFNFGTLPLPVKMVQITIGQIAKMSIYFSYILSMARIKPPWLGLNWASIKIKVKN